MNLEDQTADQIFTDMKRNTRNHIRKAEKQGVKIRELKREELDIFKRITESTSARRNFTDKPLTYYEDMYDLFHERGEVIFLIAEFSAEYGTSEDNTLRGRFGGYDRDSEERDSRDGGRARLRSEKSIISDVKNNDRGPSTLRNGTSNCRTPLSAAMFMLYGDEVIYLFSGSDEKYMKEYNAQYLIQWHMIKYALDHGFKRYNFYGIQGLPDKSSKDYGIYDFKKGFTSDKTGRVIELLGAHELPVNNLFYQLHKLLKSIKK